MKKWETPDMMTLNVNQTAMGGEEWTVIDKRYRDSNNKAQASFGEYTSSGKPVPEGGVTWYE